MSKIGRRPIDINGIQVELHGKEVRYKGSKASGVYVLPELIDAEISDKRLALKPHQNYKGGSKIRELNRVWGLHRALLSNALNGARQEFEKKIEINGLGFKAQASGKKLVFTLGFTHKIDFELPTGVTCEIDKTGQKLTVKSSNKQILGEVASNICDLRAPEPYKGTGVKLADKEIIRKAGKTK